MENQEKDRLWRQFVKLGDMIGDGLHYEEHWISKEYKKLQKILIPEIAVREREARKKRNKERDKQISKRLENDRCRKCNGKMSQLRSGSLAIKCIKCGAKYKYTTKRS